MSTPVFPKLCAFAAFFARRCRLDRAAYAPHLPWTALGRAVTANAALWVVVLLAAATVEAASYTSPLQLSTSDPHLQQAFDWAKAQALAYVSSGQDPVKYWYEAALPGRHAFCMRDISHQVMGAEALGLGPQNKSMLTLFARGISASKDGASYWEIDGEGKPSPADYANDENFWYNLPANFDVMSAAFRMYMWTGDKAYIANPAFLNFYKHTVRDYIQRWQLQPDDVLSRQRIMNRHLASGEFVNSRGIPSYTEGRKDFNLGTDLLAAEYRALRWYAELLQARGQAAQAETFDSEAAGIAHVLTTNGWNAGAQHFYGFLRQDGADVGSGDAFILYFNAATAPKQRLAALNQLKQQTRNPDPGIEEQSYRPEILFHYGAQDEAYGQILDLSRPNRKRRSYPEVSYAIIGSMVTGMMGVDVVPIGIAGTSDSGFVLGNKVAIQTLPRLSKHTFWAKLDNIPVRGNIIDVRDERNRNSSITNVSGPRFTWRAGFDGFKHFLRVNGRKVHGEKGRTPQGAPITYIDIIVAPGQTATVSE